MDDEPELTHLDAEGRAHMVDVTAKPWTRRIAVARGRVVTDVDPEAFRVPDGSLRDLFGVARLAGVAAAKRAWDLIPLCHPIRLIDVSVSIEPGPGGIDIEATTEVVAPTGVEMEALCACVCAGLSLVQSLSRADPAAMVTDVALWSKQGGRSGTWTRGS